MYKPVSSLRAAITEVERLTCTGEAAWAAAVSIGSGSAQRYFVTDAGGMNELEAAYEAEPQIHYEREEQWLHSPVDRRRLRIVTMDFVLAFFTAFKARAPRAKAHIREIETARTTGAVNAQGDSITVREVWGLYWIEDVGRRVDLGFVARPSATSWIATNCNGVRASSSLGPDNAIANLRLKEERAQIALETFVGGGARHIGESPEDPPAVAAEAVD